MLSWLVGYRPDVRQIVRHVGDMAPIPVRVLAHESRLVRAMERPLAQPAPSIGSGILDVAAALELLHAFALLPDDVMGGSAVRRGRSALHRRLAEDNARGVWRGDGRRFGGESPCCSAISFRSAPAPAYAMVLALREIRRSPVRIEGGRMKDASASRDFA